SFYCFRYRLRLGTYSGTATDTALGYHRNQPFSTFDRDNDGNAGNCANMSHGAWWYNNCHHSNLNGKWGVKADNGLRWFNGKTSLHASFSEMKIRRLKQESPSF
ncbi:tenascin-R, partial [Elysia marginata]